MKLLVLGDDKICRAFVRDGGVPPGVAIAVDQSTNIRRVLRLVRSGAISLPLLTRMALAEWTRPNAPPIDAQSIHSNTELLALVHEIKPTTLFLFRAGIIVRHNLIETGVPIWNIHCTRLPEFGGLGTIWRALQAKALDQVATLHVVTDKIDSGEVLATEPYRLNPIQSYAENERVAYAAGARLLARALRDSGHW